MPKRRLYANQLCAITQKTEEFGSTTAEAYDLATHELFSVRNFLAEEVTGRWVLFFCQLVLRFCIPEK